MEIRFNQSFYVMNIDDDFDYEGFENKLLKKLTSSYTPKSLEEVFKVKEDNRIVDVEFDIIFNNVKDILVYKKKTIKKKQNYILYTIHIPVPKRNDISWGANENNFISNDFLSKISIKDFEILNHPDYGNFETLNNFFIECSFLGIKKIFESYASL